MQNELLASGIFDFLVKDLQEPFFPFDTYFQFEGSHLVNTLFIYCHYLIICHI
jgi:hypothetical protein